jgi:hypothetical protein
MIVLRMLRVVLASAVALLMPAHAFAVVFDGKNWAQPNDFNPPGGFSWNDVATVCPVGGGLCSGSLGATSFDGWIWATVEEVASLFHAIEASFPDNTIASLEVGDGTVLETVFFGPAGFDHTFITSHPDRLVGGWSASAPIGSNSAFAPVVVDRGVSAAPLVDAWSTELLVDKNIAQGGRGVWLYSAAPVQVHEPSVLALLVLGIAAALGMRRRAA